MSFTNGLRIITITGAGCLFALSSAAQTASTSSGSTGTGTATTGTSTSSTTQNAPKPGTYGQRANNQQQRIGNGIQSGQLTAGETKHLEKEESSVNKEAQTMRSQDNGHLTAADRKALNQQQNNMSKQIYQDKHNANTAHYGNNEVGQRRENQQDRIAQGVKSGQLTAGETAKLENQQKNINHQVAADRAANGGKLTQGEKQQINKEQNKTSKNIYNKKHNQTTRKQ
jgi:hypothetical protein